MRLKACISWPYRTFMIPYFLTKSKEKSEADSTTYRMPDIPHVGTGAVWMRCGGACAVLVVCAVLAPFFIQQPIVGGTSEASTQSFIT